MSDDNDNSEIKVEFIAKRYDEINSTTNENKKTFSELLDTLEDVSEKQKSLWKLIYENALEDRKNASIAWTDLYIRVHGDEERHFKHAANLAKYMERSEKANEQILKLAALVDKASVKKEPVDEEEVVIPKADAIYSQSEAKFKHNKQK